MASIPSFSVLPKFSMSTCICFISGIDAMISLVLMRPNFWAKSDVALIMSTTARVSLIAVFITIGQLMF